MKIYERKYSSETNLIKAILKEVSEQFPNSWAVKIHGGGYGNSGIPDLMISVEGLLFAFEVKNPKPVESRPMLLKRVTPNQAKALLDIKKSGAPASVVATVEEVLEIINNKLGE